jgi:myosin heavy subunit
MAALKIQCTYREVRARRALFVLSSQRKSTIILQKVGRGFLAKTHKKRQLAAIAVIQHAVRDMIARSREEVRSCIIIQKAGRGFLARMYRKDQRAAAVIIQRVIRTMITRSRNKIKTYAATEIQRVWRGFSAHIDYMIQVMAALTIQCTYREVRARRALFVLSSQRKSTVILQKVGRGFLARTHKKKQLAAIAVIQHAVRDMIARLHDNLVRKFAAVEIQRIWRGFSTHVDYMLKVMAAIRIQVSVRFFLMKRRFHRTASASLESIQKNDLVDNSAVKESGEAKPHIYHGQRRLELFPRILVEFPEMNMDPPPRVIDVCIKREVNNLSAIPKIISAASYVSPPKKIHVRSLSKYEQHTAKAIKVLRRSALFLEVMEAVSTLEKTTCKSIDSCKLLLKARAQDNLLSLLSSCNRSSPHLGLVCVILKILTNISLHQDSLSLLVTRESSAIITDVVQMFRDKADIFTLSTSLLESFVRYDNIILSDDYSSREYLKVLREILDLTKWRASARSCPEFDKGISCLENVIRFIEGGRMIESDT